MPVPPCRWWQARSAPGACSASQYAATSRSAPASRPVSSRQQADSAARCSVRLTMWTSAIRWAAAWNVASGRPNCCLVPTCAVVSASAPARAPSARHAAPASVSWYRSSTALAGPSTWATGAESRCSVYSGPPAELGVGRSVTPSAAASTTTTPAPEAKLAGTRIQRASAAYGTPILMPETVPPPAAVAGADGIGSDGSRTAAVRMASPAATPSSRSRCWSRSPHRVTGRTPMASVARAGTGAAHLPASVSTTAVSITLSPSPSIDSGRASASRPAWASSFHSPRSYSACACGWPRLSTWAAAWAAACWVSARAKSTQCVSSLGRPSARSAMTDSRPPHRGRHTELEHVIANDSQPRRPGRRWGAVPTPARNSGAAGPHRPLISWSHRQTGFASGLPAQQAGLLPGRRLPPREGHSMATPRTGTSVAASAPDGDFSSAAQRERRQRILDATLALASKGGYEAVQMRAVAERANVALGTLYRYFPSKIHLLVSGLAREFERNQDKLDRAPIPGATPYDRVLHVLGRMTRAMQRDPMLTEAMTRAFMFADPSAAAEVNAVARSMERMFTRAMHEGEPSADEIAIARVIGDVWLSSLVAWVTRRMSASDVSNQLELAARLLLR